MSVMPPQAPSVSRRQSYESSVASNLDEKDFGKEKDLDGVLSAAGFNGELPDLLADSELDAAYTPKTTHHDSGAFDLLLMMQHSERRVLAAAQLCTKQDSLLVRLYSCQEFQNQRRHTPTRNIDRTTSRQSSKIQTFSIVRTMTFAKQRHVSSPLLVLYQHQRN